MYCLPKHLANQFLQNIKDGTFDPVSLQSMTSEERHKLFADLIGEEHAGRVNAELEKKLLLKNVERGIVNWAQWTGGLKEQTKRDIITQAERMSNILNPTNEHDFYKDLVGYKFNTSVTLEETQMLGELAQKATSAKHELDKIANPTTEERLKYGIAAVNYIKYIENLKKGAQPGVIL